MMINKILILLITLCLSTPILSTDSSINKAEKYEPTKVYINFDAIRKYIVQYLEVSVPGAFKPFSRLEVQRCVDSLSPVCYDPNNDLSYYGITKQQYTIRDITGLLNERIFNVRLKFLEDVKCGCLNASDIHLYGKIHIDYTPYIAEAQVFWKQEKEKETSQKV